MKYSILSVGLGFMSAMSMGMEPIKMEAVSTKIEYEPVASASSSSSGSDSDLSVQKEIAEVRASMKKLLDHLLTSDNSYEAGKHIKSIQNNLLLLSERIEPRFFARST